VSQPVVKVPLLFVETPERFGGRLDGGFVTGVPIWKDGKLAALRTTDAPASHMLLPKLVETHCHLDKCYTAHRLADIGGDLRAAILAQRSDKVCWTAEDLRTRAARGLDDLRRAGCGLVRSHVDWGDDLTPPLGWSVLTEMDAPQVQWAALTSIAQLAEPGFADAVARCVARTGGVLGAFILDHPQDMITAGLRHGFAMAERYGLALDFHVDEGLGTHLGIEAIADMALHTGFEGPVLCGHAVSLMTLPPQTLAPLAEKIAKAGLFVCALPTTNLYLQGRTTGTPDRRGITRLQELRGQGVRVLVGSDNVADAFCPVGHHDPMAALHLAILAGHLDPPLERWLPMITSDAARALGAVPCHVLGAEPADLLATTDLTLGDLIAARASRVPASRIFEGAL